MLRSTHLTWSPRAGTLNNIIFSDSQSAIVAIEKKKIKQLTKLNNINNQKETIFCWIQSHIGIQGNEMADSAAKTVQNNPLDTHFTQSAGAVEYTDCTSAEG